MTYGGEAYQSRGKAGMWIGFGIALMITCIVLAFVKADKIMDSTWWLFMGVGVLGGLWLMGGELFSILWDGSARSMEDAWHNWDTVIKGHPSASAQAAHEKHRAAKAQVGIVANQ